MVETKEQIQTISPVGNADFDKVNFVLNKVQDIQNNRMPLEKQWFVNIAFLFGHHHFLIDRKRQSLGARIWFAFDRLEQSRKLRRTSNKILVNFRSVLSRMLQRKARVVVDPETRMKRDIQSAKVSTEVLEDFWIRANRNNPYLVRKLPGMLMVQKYLYMYVLAFGHAYAHPYFNANTKSKTIVNGDIIQAQIGEVEIIPKMPINIFVDPMGTFMIDKEVMAVSRVKDEYNKDVEPEKIDMNDIEKQIMMLIDKVELKDVQNAVTLYKYYELPSKEKPKGRYIVNTKNSFILDEDLPEEYGGLLPYVEFNWLDLLMGNFKQGLIEQLIPLQKEYNFTISRLSEYKKYLAGKLLLRDGANLQTKWNDAVGQIIKWRGSHKPEYSVPPNPPSFLFQDLVRIEKDMQDISMAHDSTVGKAPPGVKSGVALQELSENDEVNLSPTVIEIEEKMSHLADMVLDIIANKYTQERIISKVGLGNENEVKTFLGFETKGNRRVKISLGSSLPGSRQARQAFIGGLLEAEIITPAEAKQLLQLGDVEGALDNVDERMQKFEIDQMLDGVPMDTNEWDDNRIHLKTIREYMEEPAFRDLPDNVRVLVIAHYKVHLLDLAQEVNPNENPPDESEVEVTQPVPGGGEATVTGSQVAQ